MRVIGVDEAGRGPLAGPVVAAAVILPADFDTDGIDDSKVLTKSQRQALRQRIETACTWRVVFASAEEIDRHNILRATLRAMSSAIAELWLDGDSVLVDGNRVPDDWIGRSEAVIGGDAIHACISAASILAKEHRDEWMMEQAAKYPEYGFEEHSGYGSPRHLAALKAHGPCPLHRRSFAPISDMVNQPCLDLG
jgi:ribonuclease HII